MHACMYVHMYVHMYNIGTIKDLDTHIIMCTTYIYIIDVTT